MPEVVLSLVWNDDTDGTVPG